MLAPIAWIALVLYAVLTNRAAVPAHLVYSSRDTSFGKQPMPYAVPIAVGGLFVALQLLKGV